MITIISSDNKRMVDCGSTDTMLSAYSTATVLLKDNKKDLSQGLLFLKTGECSSEKCMETARQINLIRDRLSAFPPEAAIYDLNDLNAKAPWEGNISPVITSCSNLFLTADGKDLFFELVSILTYAGIKHVSVSVAE